MKVKRFGLFVTAMAFFIIISGCGGGGDDEESFQSPVNNNDYVVENFNLSLAGGKFWSNNGAIFRNNEVWVPQNGEPYQTTLKWEDFPIRKGDRLEFTIIGSGNNGVFLKIKNKGGDITYASQEFGFQGKNIIQLAVEADDNQAEFLLMFGQKAGKYVFAGDIAVKRSRLKTTTSQTRIIPVNISQGIFWSNSGSTWDPSSGTLNVWMGQERWSTMLRWDGISITAGKVYKIVVTGYSLPTAEIIIQLKQGSQSYGEKAIEIHGESLIAEIVPSQTDSSASLVVLFGLQAGTYQLKELKIIEQ